MTIEFLDRGLRDDVYNYLSEDLRKHVRKTKSGKYWVIAFKRGTAHWLQNHIDRMIDIACDLVG